MKHLIPKRIKSIFGESEFAMLARILEMKQRYNLNWPAKYSVLQIR